MKHLLNFLLLSTVVTATYGKGRCFATLLGHDAQIMENADFQRLLIRGVSWAATGKVPE